MFFERLSNHVEQIAKYDFDNEKVFGAAYAVVSKGESFVRCY